LKCLYKPWWNLKEPLNIRYPHRWSWDSCAHSIVMTHIDLEAARQEMELVLKSQSADGFIPHMAWNRHRMHWADWVLKLLYPTNLGSPFLQPPSLAATVERIVTEYVYNETDDLDFLKLALPRLKKYYRYIHYNRVRGDDDLPEIIISYESKDRSPEYDPIYGASNAGLAPLGPMSRLTIKYTLLGWDLDRIFSSNLFRVKDTLFCCIYVQNLRALSRLCDMAGDDDSMLFADMAEKAILRKMHDEETGLFFSLDSRWSKDEQIKTKTISCLMPLILDNIGTKQSHVLVDNWLTNENEFWANYPIPVEPLSSEYQNMEIIWRGPQTWIYTNWYIEKGLRKHGYHDIADELTVKTYRMIKKEGFREYYSAKTGKGARATDYGWSALILDMVADIESVQLDIE
ncbi:trehalase family glycosidase, partial [Chloroflexota bacterium]